MSSVPSTNLKSSLNTPSWKICGINSLRYLQWQGEGEVLVFQVSTGDLHLLTEFGASILKILEQGSCTGAELIHRLRSEETLSTDEELEFGSEQRFLGEFQRLGLVELENQ